MAATFLVTNAASLKRALWLQRKSEVAIRSPRLRPGERSRLQERVNWLLGVSGYGLGLAATVAVLVLCILWAGSNWDFFVAHWFPATGLGMTACFFAGGVGRLIGFLYARWKLARVIWLTVAEMGDPDGDEGGAAAPRAGLLGSL